MFYPYLCYKLLSLEFYSIRCDFIIDEMQIKMQALRMFADMMIITTKLF